MDQSSKKGVQETQCNTESVEQKTTSDQSKGRFEDDSSFRLSVQELLINCLKF